MTPNEVSISKERESIALIAFAKNPQLVPVKTRLAESLGSEKARTLYDAMVEDCIDSLTHNATGTTYIACFPDRKSEYFKSLSDRFEVQLVNQTGNDLGERMLNCARHFLEQFETVFIFGTDLPVLPLESIVQLLDNPYWDVAIGASDDGGFYTIGLRTVVESMLDDIEWSTDNVFVQTVSKCTQAGLEVIFLDLSFDVDDERTLKKLCDDLERGEKSAPHTKAKLEAMGFIHEKKKPKHVASEIPRE